MRCRILGSWSLLLSLIWATACTQYKPQAGAYKSQTGNAANAVSGPNGPQSDLTLVVANTKLASAGSALKAKISYGTGTATQDFTPTGAQSTLSGVKLPAGSGAVLKVEFYQGDLLRFVAKKSNTTVQNGATVVIDDCLVLRAPWPGTVNEGSCEWNVTEVAN